LQIAAEDGLRDNVASVGGNCNAGAAVAALSAQQVKPEVTAPSAKPTPTPDGSGQMDPEDTAEMVATAPPEEVVEQPLTAGSSERYVSADGVYLYNYTDYPVDLTELAMPALDLPEEGPQILIIHTHTTEAYAPEGEDVYVPAGDCRTTDNYHNLVRVGEEVARVLRDGGWSVVHDLGPYDYPNYNGSYSRAGVSISRWLEQYPSIRIVLDIHRDALVAEDGTVYKTAAEVNGEKTAQVMLVVGSDAGGQNHPNWRKNLALATAVQSGLNADHPTLARPMILRSSRFNQHLSSGALLVEVGSHGNTLQEALRAARLFAASLSETLKVLSADTE
jgi:stage II sporulation protein P